MDPVTTTITTSLQGNMLGDGMQEAGESVSTCLQYSAGSMDIDISFSEAVSSRGGLARSDKDDGIDNVQTLALASDDQPVEKTSWSYKRQE